MSDPRDTVAVLPSFMTHLHAVSESTSSGPRPGTTLPKIGGSSRVPFRQRAPRDLPGELKPRRDAPPCSTQHQRVSHPEVHLIDGLAPFGLDKGSLRARLTAVGESVRSTAGRPCTGSSVLPPPQHPRRPR